MNNQGFKNCRDISEVIEKYGIKRNTYIAERPSLDGHSTLIKNETSGVEPWVLDEDEVYMKFIKDRFEENTERVSCFMTPGHEDFIGIEAARAASRISLSGDMYCLNPEADYLVNGEIYTGHKEPGFGKINMIKNHYYAIQYVSCKMIDTEDTTDIVAKPPKGRTQKAHNLIQNMNKKKRFK